MRLGDYKNKAEFGIPSLKYYRNAIDFISTLIDISSIWVFSDEPDLAKQKLTPVIPNVHTRWIGNIDDSAAATLDLMRNGVGYVIANSSFSWWAAFLSHNKNAPVVAPVPWFNRNNEPKNLYPAHWKLMSSDLQ